MGFRGIMIKLLPFKRALLMPSSRRPRVSSLNDVVRGYAIYSNGFIGVYPVSAYWSYAISSRYKRYRSKL